MFAVTATGEPTAPDVTARLLQKWVRTPSPRLAMIGISHDLLAPGVRRKVLDQETASGIGSCLSDWNLGVVARADSLLRAGFFGDPQCNHARSEAGRYLKYHALTALDFIGFLGAQDEVVWETNEDEIAPFFREFANPGVYPVRGLKHVLLGGGTFSMEFEILCESDNQRMFGKSPVRLRTRELKDGGQKRLGWELELTVLGNNKTQLLYDARYSGRLRRMIIEEEGAPLQLLILDSLEGFYVKKSGTHKCRAIVVWRNRLAADEWPPRVPRIGVAAYFPELRLHLPWLLPDVNLDDLRALAAIQPLLAADRCSHEAFPEWVEVTDEGHFREWDGEGPIPAVVRDWFPDL
jgi:hypothetical protein